MSHIDVSDNLESVPWRTTSVVRVEFVPFAPSGLPGFQMQYVSGQGIDEVWGAVASNTDPPIASTYFPGYATLYSECMELSFTKLEPGAGSIEAEPTGSYVWNPATDVWLGAAQTMKVDASAEINVKGRVIYGYNWMLKRTATNPDVLKEGWWRITFYNTCAVVPLDVTPSTATFDPTAAEPPDDGESPGPSTYPRTPGVDTENELVYIDVYIQASTTGGTGGGGRRP